VLGRGIRPGEDRPGGERVAVIGYRTWQDRFGGAPGVIGTQIRANGLPYTIVGVMPDDFALRESSFKIRAHRLLAFATRYGSRTPSWPNAAVSRVWSTGATERLKLAVRWLSSVNTTTPFRTGAHRRGPQIWSFMSTKRTCRPRAAAVCAARARGGSEPSGAKLHSRANGSLAARRERQLGTSNQARGVLRKKTSTPTNPPESPDTPAW
jgi:hypothetical protein